MKRGRNLSTFGKRCVTVGLIGLMALVSVNAVAETKTELLVSAGVGLKDVLTRLAVEFEKTHADCKIALNFAAAGQLRAQIESGAPVDILIVPSVADLDALAAKDLIIAETRITLASTRLVLITNTAQALPITTIDDLAAPEIKRIAMGNPASVPAGRYAQEALVFYQLYDALQSKLVLGENVRQVLDYVARREVEAGFVYLTDALTSNQAEVALILPDNTHAPIIFPGAIITASQHIDFAQAFLVFLQSKESRVIFTESGFAE